MEGGQKCVRYDTSEFDVTMVHVLCLYKKLSIRYPTRYIEKNDTISNTAPFGKNRNAIQPCIRKLLIRNLPNTTHRTKRYDIRTRYPILYKESFNTISNTAVYGNIQYNIQCYDIHTKDRNIVNTTYQIYTWYLYFLMRHPT